MKRLLTGAQMKQADARTIHEFGMPSLVLMERAALAVVAALQQGFSLDKVLVVCGTGNNGGDGVAVARMLRQQGIDTDVVLIGDEHKCSADLVTQIRIFENYGGTVANSISSHEYTTIVDALFGVGLTRDISGRYARIIAEINALPARILAVDIPSGIHADDGRIMGTAIQADVTVTFAYEKPGTVLYPGCQYAGMVRVADIGITDEALPEEPYLCTYADDALEELLPERPAHGNKGTFGKVLVFAGAVGMSGAACLAAEAAYRAGAGLVRVFTPEENRIVLQSVLPEAMVSCYASDQIAAAMEQLRSDMNWADVIVAGPGIGTGTTMKAFLQIVMAEFPGPLVVDADGLNLLADMKERLKERQAPLILTPHLGEMARLTDKGIADIQADLIKTAQDFAREYQLICVMKDARTIVTDGTTVYINTTGNNGMATGGSGDVLAGVTGALAGAGMKPFEAACAAVYVHGMAGDLAARKEGPRRMLASDILKYLMRNGV